MPVQTAVPGSPSEVRTAATWLRSSFAPALGGCSTAMTSARQRAASDWEGDASAGFRTVMEDTAARADDVEGAAQDAAGAFDDYATALETLQDGLAGVHDRAAAAGLATTPDSVLEPGPAPAVPPRPADDGSAPAAQVTAYNRAVTAHNDHVALVTAYNTAVDDAATLISAFDTAIGVLGVFVQRTLSWTTWATAAVIATEQTFARYVTSIRSHADSLRQSARWAEDAYLRSPGGSVEAQLQERLRVAATAGADDALSHADDLSRGKLARMFGGKLPIVGTLVTVAGIGWDVSTGTPPSSAIVGGLAAAGATAATVAVVSGPVGWVVAAGVVAGIGVGMGAQWAWDTWVPADVRKKIDDGITEVWDATSGAVVDGWNATTGAVADGWNSFSGGVSRAWGAIF